MQQRVVSCPGCGAANARGKFCSECGEPLSLTRSCEGCSAEIPSGAKFCPECGQKAA
jgi:membrane protease subunit (stomatin/prohibitin family)